MINKIKTILSNILKNYKNNPNKKKNAHFFELHEKYLKTIKKLKFDPIILFISAIFSHSLNGLVALYLILLITVHLPIIFYKNQ